jgi:hypothetical protein
MHIYIYTHLVYCLIYLPISFIDLLFGSILRVCFVLHTLTVVYHLALTLWSCYYFILWFILIFILLFIWLFHFWARNHIYSLLVGFVRLSFELYSTLSRDLECFLLSKCPGTKSSAQTINFWITFRNCSRGEHKRLQHALRIWNKQPRATSHWLTKARSSRPASCPYLTQVTPPTVFPRKELLLVDLDSSNVSDPTTQAHVLWACRSVWIKIKLKALRSERKCNCQQLHPRVSRDQQHCGCLTAKWPGFES